MKLTDYLVNFLAKKGVTHVFGYAGGAIAHVMDSLSDHPNIQFVSTYHEQAAAFAAEGYARLTNNLGVAIATSGPGATNLITGIGSAYFDSIPCLYITGQVNTYEFKGRLKMRQKGFQELDIVSLVKPITKYAKRITNASDIRFELEKAFEIATSGRKGPVVLDIPMDIQRANILPRKLVKYKKDSLTPRQSQITPALKKRILNILAHAQRPVVLIGGGVRSSNATEGLRQFLKKTQIPFVGSLMGLDACDVSLPNYCGFIGAYGSRCGNLTLANSDLILSIGSRLDMRQTGTNIKIFARDAKLIRVDIDVDELKNKIKSHEIAVKMDANHFMKDLVKGNVIRTPNLSPWHGKIRQYQSKYSTLHSHPQTSMDPNVVLETISKFCGDGDVFCMDVGQNQMWAAQSIGLKKDQRLLFAGGMGAMGFAIPAAVGAYYANPKLRIIVVAGDGGMQINIQELQLLKRNKIPLKIIIMNNHNLGMIRHFQEMYFKGNYEGTVDGYSAPDFSKVARAYGLDALAINKLNQLGKVKTYLNNDKAVVIDVNLSNSTYVYPKLAVNRPIEDQEPLMDREEFYSNMIVKPMK